LAPLIIALKSADYRVTKTWSARSTYPSKVLEEAPIRYAAAVPRSKYLSTALAAVPNHSKARAVAPIRFATGASRSNYSTVQVAVPNRSKVLAAVLNHSKALAVVPTRLP